MCCLCFWWCLSAVAAVTVSVVVADVVGVRFVSLLLMVYVFFCVAGGASVLLLLLLFL